MTCGRTGCLFQRTSLPPIARTVATCCGGICYITHKAGYSSGAPYAIANGNKSEPKKRMNKRVRPDNGIARLFDKSANIISHNFARMVAIIRPRTAADLSTLRSLFVFLDNARRLYSRVDCMRARLSDQFKAVGVDRACISNGERQFSSSFELLA